MLPDVVVLSVGECLEVSSPRGKRFRMTDRRCCGLTFCRDNGKITYTSGGERVISDRYHAVILPQGGSYDLYGNESGSFPVIDFTCAADVFGGKLLSIPIADAAEYLYLFDRLQRYALFGQTYAAMAVLYELFDKLQNENTPRQPLFPAVKYLQAHFGDPGITAAALAERCEMSEVGFRKKFTRLYGTSPKQYLLSLRLGHAKVLLCSTDRTVTAIAEECGFSGVYQFCRFFRQREGTTPQAYRQSRAAL